MKLSSEVSCRAFVFGTFAVVLIFVVSLNIDYSAKNEEKTSNSSKSFDFSNVIWPMLQISMSVDRFYLDEFIPEYRRDFVYESVISVYVLFLVTSTVLNFSLGFGIYRSGNNLPERHFFDVIGQLVFCNIIWTACNAAKTVPIVLLFKDLINVQHFRKELTYYIMQISLTFSNTYTYVLLLVLCIYAYFYFVLPEKLDTLKKRFRYFIIFCFILSVSITLFAAYAECTFDRQPNMVFNKNQMKLVCDNIYSRYTLNKIEYVAYIARLTIFVLPVNILCRVWYYIRNSSYTLDPSTSNIFSIAAATFSLYQLPLFLTVVRQFYFFDLEFLFYEDRIIETAQLYSFIVIVYVVFRHCKDIQYGFLGKRRSSSSPVDIGIVRYTPDMSPV